MTVTPLVPTPLADGLRVRTTLRIQRLELQVRLGCGDAERASPQPVELDLEIRFASVPRGCRSDRLDDTVCYADLAERARELVAGREFHLVEHLGFELHRTLRDRLPGGARLDLEIRKVAPPIEALHGGVSFRLEDD